MFCACECLFNLLRFVIRNILYLQMKEVFPHLKRTQSAEMFIAQSKNLNVSLSSCVDAPPFGSICLPKTVRYHNATSLPRITQKHEN